MCMLTKVIALEKQILFIFLKCLILKEEEAMAIIV